MKKLLIIAILLISELISAQLQVKGTVHDQYGEPLAFASIILQDSEDSSQIFGTITTEEGVFVISDVPEGDYSLKVSLLGFTSYEAGILVNQNMVPQRIVLSESATALDEVIVQGNRPTLRQSAEKLILDLENSELVSANLQDVMKNVPGIIVVNGQLSYAGRRNLTILINGKRTDYIDTEALLRDFPADNIARIELIQQPGAEYDAEGSGPLINVVLKRNAKLGTTGSLRSQIGNNNEFTYGTSASIASYVNRLNWRVYVGARKSAWREDLTILRTLDGVSYNQASISPYDPRTYQSNLNVDYYLAEKHSAGINASFLETDSDRIAASVTGIESQGSSADLLTDNQIDRQRNTTNINPYYEYKDDKNKLVADYNFVRFSDVSKSSLVPTSMNKVPFEPQRFDQDGTFRVNTFRLDYTYNPSEKSTWQVGLKYADIATDSDLKSYALGDQNNPLFVDAQSNRFIIDETIAAIYLKWSASLDDYKLSAGLRYEDSRTAGTSITANQTLVRDIERLFPSASLTRKITDELSAVASYSYRINRPDYSSLNSFVSYYDPYTSERGNPTLRPSFTHNLSLSLTYEGQPFFSLSRQTAKDELFLLVTQDNATAQVSRATVNLDDYESYQFQLFAPIGFIGKAFDGFTGLIVDYTDYSAPSLEVPLYLDRWSATWFTSLDVQLPFGISSSWSAFYNSGSLEGVIITDHIANFNVSFSKTLADDAIKINASIGDILNRKFYGRIDYAGINANVISDWPRQTLQLQVTYNFGSNYGKNKQRGNGSAEELSRIGNNN